MEVSLRLADTIFSFKIKRLSRVGSGSSSEADILRIAKREKNIKMILAEKEHLTIKAKMNCFKIF